MASPRVLRLEERHQARRSHEGRGRARILDAGAARVLPAANLRDLGLDEGVEVEGDRGVDGGGLRVAHRLRGLRREEEAQAVAVRPAAYVVVAGVVGRKQRLVLRLRDEVDRAGDGVLARGVVGETGRGEERHRRDRGAADAVAVRDLAAHAVDALVGPLGGDVGARALLLHRDDARDAGGDRLGVGGERGLGGRGRGGVGRHGRGRGWRNDRRGEQSEQCGEGGGGGDHGTDSIGSSRGFRGIPVAPRPQGSWAERSMGFHERRGCPTSSEVGTRGVRMATAGRRTLPRDRCVLCSDV